MNGMSMCESAVHIKKKELVKLMKLQFELFGQSNGRMFCCSSQIYIQSRLEDF